MQQTKLAKRNLPESVGFYLVRVGGIFAVILYRIWLKISHKTQTKLLLSSPMRAGQTVIFAANHQKRTDPIAIFSSISLVDLYRSSPVKFLTWRGIYNTVAKPILFLTGCFSTHGKGKHGVSGSVYYAKLGYKVFIFPEGKRVHKGTTVQPYSGISYILDELPNVRLVLIKIDWQERKRLFSRPVLNVTFADAPKELDRSNPESIMTAIYRLK